MHLVNIKKIILFLFVFGFTIYPQNQPINYKVATMKNLFNDVNVNDASAAYKVWIDLVGKPREKDFTLDMQIYNDFDEVNAVIQNGHLAVLSLSISDYFKYKDKYNLEPGFVPSYNGRVGFSYLLLTRKDVKFEKLMDLKGTKIGISTNYDPKSSIMWFETVCAENGIKNKEKFFSEITETPKESQLILNLFFGKIDACIVREKSFELMNELNPQIGESIKPLITSPDYMIAVTCFTRDFNNEYHKKIFIDGVLNLHNSISGKQLMTLMKIDKLVPFKEEYIKTYIDLLTAHKKLAKVKK